MTDCLGLNRLIGSRWMTLLLALAMTTGAYAADGPGGLGTDGESADDDAMPGVVLVQFKAGVAVPTGAAKTGLASFDRRAAKHEVYALEPAFPMLEQVASKRALSEPAEALRRVYVVRYNTPRSPSRVAAALAQDPNVALAEPHYIRYLTEIDPAVLQAMATPNDTRFANMTHLQQMRMADAWDVVKGETGEVIIAIIDGGTDWRHPDLRANIWENPGEVDGNGVDDDNNGFVDDIRGWNFATATQTSNGTPDPSGLPSLPTNALHGTAVAGTAAAVTDNDLGVAGTSWNATFMAINASCPSQDNAICFGYRGLLYAALNGADVINASWGGDRESQIELQVIAAVREEGALVVASAGNDGRNSDREPFYPAGYIDVLSVGGTQKSSDANVWNYGRSVNVFAPGIRIDTTFPNEAYGTTSGTSFSSPLVAGIAGLVKTLNPTFTLDQVREQVRMTADNIDAANPSISGRLGRGRINAHRAVTETGNPAVRLTDWSFVDEDGDFDIRSGERVTVTATFTNYLADATGLTVELDSDDTFLSFPNGSVNVGTLASGASTTVEFEFELAENTPNNRTLILFTRAIAGSYTDTPDVIRMPANETSVVAHNSGALQTTITNEGNIGYLAFQGDSQGIGFRALDVAGVRRDLLFEGGLLVATGPDKVSDCVRGVQVDPDQEEDFVLKPGTILEIISPAEFTTQQGRVELVDSVATSPLGVSILQESFVDVGPDNEDFLILKYTIANLTEAPLTNLHVGLFFDWDINQVDPSSDYGRFDQEREMGYLQDDANSPTILVGTKVLTHEGNVSYRAIDNPTQIYRDQVGGGFTEQEKWDFLSGGIQDETIERTDASQLIGAGPFTIDPGSSIETAFVVVAGRNLADLQQNADNAQTLWDGTLGEPVAVEDNAPAPGVFAFHAAYPNPAVPPTTFGFQVAAPSEVALTVYDVLGRKVRTLDAGRRGIGTHAVVWDGADDAGQQVASGLYLVRLTARSNATVFTESRPVVVVR